MPQKTRLSVAGLLLAFACAARAVPAREAEDMLAGYVSLSSNYVGRGLAQSTGHPSLAAEIDYNPGDGWYAGLSAANINWIDEVYPGDSVSVELDGWLGYRRTFAGDWTFKGGLLRIQFPGRYVPQTPPAARPDTTEAYGFLAWRDLSARLNYSLTDSIGTPDSRGSWYLDVAATIPLSERWSAGLHLGRRQSRGTNPVTGAPNARFSFTDYKVLLARSFPFETSATLAYTWTNADPALYTLNGYNVAGHLFWIQLQKNF